MLPSLRLTMIVGVATAAAVLPPARSGRVPRPRRSGHEAAEAADALVPQPLGP